MRLAAGFVVIGIVCSSVFAAERGQRTLTFEDRVAAQKAIEQVYWNHRIWPNENPGPKPPLSAVMSDDAIRAKVEDYLKKSNALGKWWQRSISAYQLQAEVERIAKYTKDRALLEEVFRALGNDPIVIAETMARQTLVDRLIHGWYMADSRFHGDLRRKAEAALVNCGNADCMRSMGGEYGELTRKRSAARANAHEDRDPRNRAMLLDDEEWNNQRDRLARQLGGTADALPRRTLSRLEETPEAFVSTTVLAQREDELQTAEVAWRKRSFDEWWAIERASIGSDIDPLPGTFTLPTVPAVACVNDTWTPTTARFPDSRFNHTAVWTGSEMIVWGGSNSSSFFSTGGRYNPSTDTWTSTSTGPNVPDGRDDHVAVWSGTEFVVWGGESLASNALNTGGRYNPATDTWRATSTGAGVPSGRIGATAIWTGTQMIVWGGSDNSGFVNSGGRYNPSTDTWAATSTTNGPVGRFQHTAVWTGTEMIVWGGENGAPDYVDINSGGRYNPTTNTWVATSTGVNVPYARRLHSAVWTGTEMIVWGGSDGNSGGRYNPSNDTWRPTSIDSNTPARVFNTVVWTGRQMIVWGGQAYPAAYNTGARYNPSTDTWTPTSTGANVPAGRYLHTAVWTGSKMIVWGGSDSIDGTTLGVGLSTGGCYEPNTDSWTPTSIGLNIAVPRYRNTAVWTGSEMIVWGGHNEHSFYSSGARYSPATDSATPTSVGPNLPSARAGHVAVWTGRQMVIWGGSDANSYLNTGGRYDPMSDSWLATSTGAAAPAGRYYHTAVWTGREMIVWGGSNWDASYMNTGGRYDPTKDIWTATSTGANAPLGRAQHTAVWTGSEMIVWGGDAGNLGELSDGARYSPSTDSWIPTPSAFAPFGRYLHTAVWTGTEMIVWGGSNGSEYDVLNSGGRYNPSSDTWGWTSIGVNVPAPRFKHTAVWTGSEMIVWGGFNTSRYLKTGGRYSPSNDSWIPTSISGSTPVGRQEHTAVWTGTELIVWGGYPVSSSGGGYCACPNGRVIYRDADGDGFGSAIPTPTCDGTVPPGYVTNQDDCDDTNPAVHPGAVEICDGLDDDCNGTVDDGGDSLCDDHDVCTADSCHGANGCVFAFCNDGNPCTYDTCDTGVGCVFTNNTSPCNDGNACTLGDTCLGGDCVPGAGTLACSDGNPCTTDTCNPTNGCVFTAIVCNDNNSCTDDSCNSANGICTFTNDDNNSCSDGSVCTQTDACHAGVCVGSNPVQCNGGCPAGFTQIGVLCQKTYDIGESLLDSLITCDGTGTNRYNNCGFRTYGFHWTDLGDSLAAVTRIDVQLEAGISCGGGPSNVTLNGVPAGSVNHAGSCECTSVHATRALPTLPTGAYLRAGVNVISITPTGQCEGLSKSANLASNFARVTVTYSPHSNPCQAGTCDPATGACIYSNLPDGTSCSDGSACTTGDTCQAGTCVGGTPTVCAGSDACQTCDPATGTCSIPVVCVPSDQCHIAGTCDASTGACSNPPKADGASCTDGNPCTTGDVCAGGGCQPGAGALDCNDNNPCTDDGCSPATGCVHSANTAPCDDGNLCTTGDVCGGGGCHPGAPVVCNDNNLCTTDTCSPASGCVFTNAPPCNDGNPCTIDSCDPASGCVFTPIVCDDGNPCTNDFCTPTTGCIFTYTTNPCDDGNACTLGDACSGGVCHGAGVRTCNDNNPCTDDSCNPAIGCVFTNNARTCDDLNVCTVNDTCAAGTCRGTPIVCDDGNACTTDSCNPASGCVSINNTNSCDDGNACTTGDICGPPTATVFLAENFDAATAPALPASWSTSVVGIGSAWATRNSSGDSAPNSAFGLDNDQTADEVLDTPPIAITSAAAKLTFRNRWNLDGDSDCFDAGVLEIKIGGGSFADILAAGGSFVTGGYNGTVSPYYANPLAGRPGWCSVSTGYPAYLTTTVNLPAAAAGNTIRLRFRLGSDSSASSVGQDIDSVVIENTDPRNTCHAGPPVDCDDHDPCTVDACDPTAGCIHVNSGAVPEIQRMTASADKTTYSWTAATFATRYDVVRGSTAAFPVGPGGGDEVCFDNVSGTSLSDTAVPPLHTGFWYLSRGENACGIGTWGNATSGPRVTATCP